MATNIFLSRLVESIAGDASKAQNQAKELAIDLKAAGEDITDDEVQAAMLGALIDADGKIEDVDVSDVEKIADNIKEGRLSEGAGVLGTIHTVGDVLGNAALIHVLAAGITKLTGKTIDEQKLKETIEYWTKKIKNVSGFVGNMIEKAIEWIAENIFGADIKTAKIAGITGLMIVTITLGVIGILLFPSITSTVSLVFTVLALIGKGGEMATLISKLWKTIKASKEEIEAEHAKEKPSKSDYRPGEASFGAE
jgi:hypothetical protein